MKDLAQFRRTFKWSATRLLQILVCAKQFWYDRLSEIEVPKPWYFVFGAAVHDFVEFAHKGPRRTRFKPTPQRPLFYKSPASMGNAWYNYWSRYVDVEGKDSIIWNPPWNTYKKLAHLGKQLFSGGGGHKGYYPTIMDPPLDYTLCAVELTFSTDFYLNAYESSAKLPIVGKFDQLWRVRRSGILESCWQFPAYDEAIAVMDLTTSRSSASDAKYLQIALYLEALSVLIKEDPKMRQRLGSGCQDLPLMGLVWNLRRGTIVPRWSWHRNRLAEQLIRAHELLNTGIFVPRDNDWVCKSCRWRAHCRDTEVKPIDLGEPDDVLHKVSIDQLVERKPKPPKQLFFTGGMEKGGWMRGAQIRGED